MSSIFATTFRSKLGWALLVVFCLAIATQQESVSSASEVNSGSDGSTVVTISDAVKVTDVKRFGVNIGARDQYGAAQHLKNLIPNPGFEAGEFNMLFLMKNHQNGMSATADFWDTSWNNDAGNIGQPVDFWNGATYEFVTGKASGRTGSVSDFSHDDDLYTFHFSNTGIWPDALDIVAVRQELAGYYGDTNAYASADVANNRPSSDGTQALRLDSAPSWGTSYEIYFDSYGRDNDREAGKLIVVDGTWYFEIYAKAETAGDTLNVTFRRVGESSFMNETFTLTTEWQKYSAQFTVAPGMDSISTRDGDGLTNPLAFEMRLAPTSGAVWTDDVVLERANQTNPTVFNDTFVEMLGELQPGILRNWGDQLGSSLDNQLAPQFGRKTTGHNPNSRIATKFHFGLHEFLELCAQIDAEPWYVVPPSFSAEEMANLAAYLAAPSGSHAYGTLRSELGQTAPWTDVFETIHIEYGNEIWGAAYGTDPFLGATVRGGERAGQIASLRFGQFKASPYYDSAEFNLAIGGQTFYSYRQDEIERSSENHDSIGLAPYFGHIDSYESYEAMFYPLYAHAQETVTSSAVTESRDYVDGYAQGTELAIYELNLHAVSGDAPTDVRNNFLSGLGGGMALPLTMLNYQSEMGIRNIMSYRALQFSQQIGNGDYARLFGLMRDLQATSHKRPTWLGIEMANRAVKGDLLQTSQSGVNPAFRAADATMDMEYVQSFAYRDGDNYSVILFNLNVSETQSVRLDLPANPNATASLSVLHADSVISNNESSEQVKITSSQLTDFSQNYLLTMDPHTMVVLEWSTGNSTTPTAVGLSSASASSGNVILLAFILSAMLLAAGTIYIRKL